MLKRKGVKIYLIVNFVWPMKKEISCGAVVYYYQDNQPQFLIIKNLNSGYYGFPKGHIEGKESDAQTAIREVFEETGIQIKLKSPDFVAKTYRFKVDGIVIDKTVKYFLAEAINTQITHQVEEIIEASWLPTNQVEKRLTYQTDREVFFELTKELLK